LLTFILTAIFYDELKQVIIVAGYTIAGLLIITFLLIAMLLTWYLLERIRLFRARRIEAEKQAHVLTVTARNQVFVRDTDQQALWRVMHLEARTFSNAQFREPTELQFQQWQLFNSPHRVPNKPVELLPSQTQVDLLAALNSVQRCLIVGASDSGKTTLLQWLISRKLHTSSSLSERGTSLGRRFTVKLRPSQQM
jgi:ABC-type multidrug transport system fused ATPase/permease subunit